jgi:hypothetical protein
MTSRTQRAAVGAVAWVFISALTLAAQERHIFRGEICSGPPTRTALVAGTATAPPCFEAHARRGAHYVLVNPEKKAVYQLSGHAKARPFAGSSVVVVGTLDRATSTIDVDEMFRALPPVVTRGKSVYIDCDACERGMAAAWLAAFEQLTEWGRYDVVPDPRKADLIFLLSANPYLGDYITRDGPDKRPVHVDITHLDVVDPRTGESLWDDSRQWGSLFVARATKDLIQEFKEQLELEEHAGQT